MAKRIKREIITTPWLAFGLLLSIIAFRQFAWPRIEAITSNQAADHLKPPYLRLTRSPIQVAKSQAAIDVKVNTAGIETTEVDVVINFDPEVLAIKKDQIRLPDQFAIFQISQTEEGRLDFAVFSDPNRGEPALSTSLDKETRLATLVFDLLDSPEEKTALSFEFAQGRLDESNLIPSYEKRPSTPVDILQTVEGTSVSLLNSF
jgi:hypothetical protein